MKQIQHRRQRPQRPSQQGTQQAQGQDQGISTPQLFIITFAGWLILEILSPREWRSVIGTFLTLESTVLFLVGAIRSGNPPQNSTIQFLLAAYLGYFILYRSSAGDDSGEAGNQPVQPRLNSGKNRQR